MLGVDVGEKTEEPSERHGSIASPVYESLLGAGLRSSGMHDEASVMSIGKLMANSSDQSQRGMLGERRSRQRPKGMAEGRRAVSLP